MKWQSHLKIAEWVGSELNFSPQEILQLARGSIAPDKWWDRAFHHNHKYLDGRISKRIVRARKLFLTHNPQYFFELGIALHYIADRLIPQSSYIGHIEIEEEVAKIAQSRHEDKHKWVNKNHIEETRKKIECLELSEEEKTLLLDPGWTRGKQNTLTLALTNLPPHTDSELLWHIAARISIGVATAVISKEPPPMLIDEKYKVATKSILNAIPRFKFYTICIISLPLLFFIYGKMGVVAYLFVMLLNLMPLISIILILKSANKVQKYLIFRECSKTLFVFFLIGGLVALVYKLFCGIVFLLLGLVHLFYPKIIIDKEVENEIYWYGWS